MSYFPVIKKILCLLAAAVSAMICCSCSSGGVDDETAYRDLGLYRTADLPNLLDSARSAIETGKILIPDERKFNQVFDSDPTRFTLGNLRPMSITVEAYSSAVRIEFFVADSITENGEYAVVTVRSETRKTPVVIDCSLRKLGESQLNRETGRLNYFYSPEKHGVRPPVMSDPAALSKAQKTVDEFINSGNVKWTHNVSVDSNSPVYEWISCKLGDKPISHSDLLLRKIDAGKDCFIYSYCVTPLMVRNSPDSVDFHFIIINVFKDGKVSQAGTSSVTLNDAITVVPSPLSQKDIDAVCEAAFRYMFGHALTGEQRSREEQRLILPPFNVSAKFLERFNSRFSKPLADSMEIKTTRYSISSMLPVDSETVFVTSMAVNDLGAGRILFLKLEKSFLFGWSVSSERDIGSMTPILR